MRTALWSLAFLGSAIAAPSANDYEPPAYDMSSSSSVAPVTVTLTTTRYTTYCPCTATQIKGSATEYSTYMTHSTVTEVYSKPSATVYKPETTVEELTTVYTTVCPVTATETHGETTLTKTYETTSTLTSVYSATVTINKPSAPVYTPETPETTVEEFTTIYTTVCPVTATETHGETTLTKTYETTSTVTSVYSATVTANKPEAPKSSSPETSKPVESYSTKEFTTTYETVCPETVTGVYNGNTYTQTYETTSTVTSVITSTMTASASLSGESSEHAGHWTTFAWGTTHLSYSVPSYDSATLTVPVLNPFKTTSVSTETVSPYPSGSGSGSMSGSYSGNATESHIGSETGSYTGSATGSYTSSTDSTTGSYSGSATGSHTDNKSGSYTGSTGSTTGSYSGSATGSYTGSTSGSYTGSVTSPTASSTNSASIIYSAGNSSTYGPGSTGFGTGFGTGSITSKTASSTNSATYSAGNSSAYGPGSTGYGTGSITSHTASSTNSASFTYSAGNSSTYGPGSTGFGTGSITSSKASSTNSASITYSAGNSSTYGPGSTGFGTGSKTTSSATSTSTCSKPTQNPFEICIPCEGQRGGMLDEHCGYTINDNSYEVTPKTCQTLYYDFEITNTTVAPDGVSRVGLLVNGQMPGPKIEANWGDTVVVRVKNNMQNNGTSIHFHGIRQYYTNEMDGVPSITQCAIAPGEEMTYTWVASNYGTSWYHSHFALQTYEGVFGPMVIHGPAAEEYDEEEVIVIQDWSHATADSMYQSAQSVGPAPDHGPRTLDTGLINGQNVWGDDGAIGTTGERYLMNVIYGRTYRLRLVNTAIQSSFKFMIDGHTFKVIANDFVPIVPYETNIVNINIGQRYDLIFTADQPIDNYWMRADNQNICASITHATNIKGIVSYLGALPFTPTTTAYEYTEECVDEPLASLVPIVPINAGVSADQTIEKTVLIGPDGGTPNLFKWTLSGTSFQSQWGDATLNSIVNNGSVPTYSGNLAIEVPNLKEWVYVIIDSPIPLPHPIHLHGHDFLILAQGAGMYSSDVVLNTQNPPRRDVALMPWDPVAGMGGHLVLAFESDNPGVWLMHCHIGWHTSMGFAMQIIENLEGIKDSVKDSCQMKDTCSKWNGYCKDNDIMVEDSGV